MKLGDKVLVVPLILTVPYGQQTPFLIEFQSAPSKSTSSFLNFSPKLIQK